MLACGPLYVGMSASRPISTRRRGSSPSRARSGRTPSSPSEYVAQIRAIQHIELRALEKGYLQGIFVDEGQRVAKGTRMFQIMPLIYQAEVQKAQAEAELAEIEFKNTKLLADKNVVSPNELALAKAKLDKAKAEVALATTHKSLHRDPRAVRRHHRPLPRAAGQPGRGGRPAHDPVRQQHDVGLLQRPRGGVPRIQVAAARRAGRRR